ncbi:hypothetical protein ACQKIC_16340 [Peribacillus sp. NPDC046944]|uniref:hypothetical protein n=1 Tax=unclassified Peribacillus TaxID=2675266 RepID=UPI003D00010A
MNMHEEAVKNLKVSSLEKVIDRLNKDDFYTDEHGILSKMLIKYASETLFRRLEDMGVDYELRMVCKYYNSHGEVSAIYNADVFNSGIDFIKLALDPFVEMQEKVFKNTIE